MDELTFGRFKKLIYEKSGILLADGKESLVTARIARRMRELNLECPRAYLDLVVNNETGEELVGLLDAITTNVTNFFREPEHFSFFENVLTACAAKGQQKFRVWSAACSTGEEPYSIAMSASKCLSDKNVDLRILATDLSTRVLKKCMSGVYTPEQIRPLPKEYQMRYLVQTTDQGRPCFQVSEELRKLVVFSKINLSAPPFPMSGPFDFVFCRNVMIYFDDAVRRRLVSDMCRLLRPGGFLLVGHSETLTGMDALLRSIRPSIYQKAAA